MGRRVESHAKSSTNLAQKLDGVDPAVAQSTSSGPESCFPIPSAMQPSHPELRQIKRKLFISSSMNVVQEPKQGKNVTIGEGHGRTAMFWDTRDGVMVLFNPGCLAWTSHVYPPSVPRGPVAPELRAGDPTGWSEPVAAAVRDWARGWLRPHLEGDHARPPAIFSATALLINGPSQDIPKSVFKIP